jgi:hypothetical protein
MVAYAGLLQQLLACDDLTLSLPDRDGHWIVELYWAAARRSPGHEVAIAGAGAFGTGLSISLASMERVTLWA